MRNRRSGARRPVEKGDEFVLEVTGLGEGADGLAYVDDYVVFVVAALPGERVRARIVNATRKYARAEVLELLSQSPARVEPECRHFASCGGCHRQHQAYDAQLDDKRARIRRVMDYVFGDRSPDVGAAPAEPPYGQRNKVALHVSDTGRGLEACFHRLRTPELVRVVECPTSDPLAWDLANDTVRILREYGGTAYDPDKRPDGVVRSVVVRAATTGESHVLLVMTDPYLPDGVVDEVLDAGATTVSVNIHHGERSRLLGPSTHVVAGPDRIEERIGDVTYLLSPTAFFQTSPQAAARMVQLAHQFLGPSADDIVADLYCGVGLFGLQLARHCRQVIGFEISSHAVDDATAAAMKMRIRNATFHAGPVESGLSRLGGRLPWPNLVVVDPPRSGLESVVIDHLSRIPSLERIVYVSCDPQALQRDMQALASAGFVPTKAVVVDMFPQTSHIETFVGLERVGGR